MAVSALMAGACAAPVLQREAVVATEHPLDTTNSAFLEGSSEPEVVLANNDGGKSFACNVPPAPNKDQKVYILEISRSPAGTFYALCNPNPIPFCEGATAYKLTTHPQMISSAVAVNKKTGERRDMHMFTKPDVHIEAECRFTCNEPKEPPTQEVRGDTDDTRFAGWQGDTSWGCE